MTESNMDVVVAVVEEHYFFTLTALCRATGAQRSEVQSLVLEGLLEPDGGGPEDWRFSAPALQRARSALRLVHDLDLGWSGAAIVMDLLDEIEALKIRLQRG